jgi:hypothetical protein
MENIFIRLKRWNENKKLNRAIKRANKFHLLTGYCYLVFRYKKKFIVCRRTDLKKALRQKQFKKGCRIESLERGALYKTTATGTKKYQL